MEALKQIIKIVEKHTGCTAPEYTALELFPLEGVRPNSFEAFLIRSRVNLFLKLHLLDMFTDSTWLAAFEEYPLFEEIEDTYPTEYKEIDDLGPNISDGEFTREDLFEAYLSRTGIAALIASDKTMDGKGNRLGLDGELDQHERSRHHIYPEIFVMISPGMKAILTEDHIYVDKTEADLEEVIRQRLATHTENFARFIHTYKDSGGVPHEIYIQWLLKWFPGKVKIRSLPGPANHL